MPKAVFNPLANEELQLYPTADEYDSRYVNVTGDTMTGDLIFSNSQKIIGGTSTTADLTLQTTSGVGASGADIHFLVGNNGATEAMTVLNNGNVGVNTTAPDFKLDVALAAGSGQSVVGRFYKSGEANAFLQTVNFVGSATGGGFAQLAFARGTEASPTIITNGDRIGGFFFSGYDGDQFINGAGIFAYADNTVADNSVPTRLTFETGTNTRTERLSISSTGVIVVNETGADSDLRIEGVGNASLLTIDASTDSVAINVALGSHVGKFHVSQSSTTAAKPVLTLTQADVSEEFIRFIGSSANGVLTQSIVEAADVGTATVAGYIKCFIQDDGNQLTDQAYYLPIYTLS